MPTQVTRYVNTDSTAGGDGTTNATSGATRAYATIAAALAEVDGDDIVSADQKWTFNCSAPSGVADTSQPGFTLTNDDSTRYVEIIGEWYGGEWDETKYRIEGRQCQLVGANGVMNNIRLQGLQFRSTGSGTQDASAALRFVGGGGWIDRCIFTTTHTGSGTNGHPAGLYGDSGLTELYVSNCIFKGFNKVDGYRNAGGAVFSYPSAKFSNCLFIDCRRGVWANGDGSTSFLRNCIFQCDSEDSSYTDIVGPWHATNSYNNLTSDATCVGTSQTINTTLTFRDKAGGDYYLAASDTAAINTGADLSAQVGVTILSANDINNLARVGTWDIGPHEYVAPATGYKNLLLLGVG